MTASAPLTVLLVGAGFVAPFHLAGWRACANVRVVAAVVCDPVAEAPRLRELGIERAYRDLVQAIDAERPDVVDICSPPDTHAAHVRTCIEAGLPFMCQKPLATDFDTARSLVDAATGAGLRAMVHENFRYRRWNRAMKAILDSGRLGEIFHARSAQRMAGTVRTAEHPRRPWSLARQPFFASVPRLLLLESVIHQFDVARFWFGTPGRLFARCRRVSDAVRGEDCAMVMLCHDRLDMLVERSYASKGYPPPASGNGESVVVEGSEGSAFISPLGEVRTVIDGPAGRREEHVPVNGRDAYAASYADCIAHFVDALRNDRDFESDLADNLQSLRLVFAAYRSAESGEAVDLTVTHPENIAT